MRSNTRDGGMNETLILSALNRHYFKDLDEKWKRHMKRMFKEIKDDDFIICNYYQYKDAKPDIEIIVRNRKVFLSIKSGHAPTVHREPIKTFFEFLRSLGVPERIIKIIAFYHYGYSLKKDIHTKVLSRQEIIEKYSKYIKEVNNYFLDHKEIVRELIYRTIIKGRLKRDLIEYFYYGNSAKGFLLSCYDIIDLILKDRNEECSSICFYSLTYVSCARNPKRNDKHRVQISWPVLCKYYYDKEFLEKYDLGNAHSKISEGNI